MDTKNMHALLDGYQVLAVETLLLIQPIEDYFKSFDGERALIQSGASKKFKDLRDAFYAAVKPITSKPRITVNANTYDVSVTVDLWKHHPGSMDQGAYYQDWIYLGEVKDGIFHYTFDAFAKRKSLETILGTSLKELEIAVDTIKELEKSIDNIKHSIPSKLRAIFG